MVDKKEVLNLSEKTNSIEISESAARQIEKLDNNPDKNVELSPRDIEARAEKARAEVMQTAVSIEINGKKIEKNKINNSASRPRSISKKQRNESYAKTLKQVQKELPPSSRIFSKITHNKIIEKTSDVIGNTIARPNAMLAGAVAAFILTLITYTVSKIIGYSLSGSETIIAFLVGWIVGIVYDYLRILFTGKN